MMHRPRFLFPAAWALGAHALLLVVSRPDLPAASAIPTAVAPLPPVPVDLIDPLIEEPLPADAADAAPTGEPVPRAPERLSPVVPDGAITQPVQPDMPPTVLGPVSVIPADWRPAGGPPTDSGPRIWDGTKLDATPRAVRQVAPQYPYAARQQRLTGEVWLEFVVDEEGRVHDPRVTRASHREFEVAALRAVAQWRFEPGRKDGRIVRFRLSQPLVFALTE